MRVMVGMVVVIAAAAWCGAAWAAPGSTATSAAAVTTTAKSPVQIRFEKSMAEIEKMLDDIQALDDKLPDLEGKVSDDIHKLKDAKGAVVDAKVMQKELGTSSPSAPAKQYRSLKQQVIKAMMEIAGKLGPKGAYGKCLELEKTNPKDDDLKKQSDDLTAKVKMKYMGMLRKIGPLFAAIADVPDEDGMYKMMLAVDPNDAVATAYFKKKDEAKTAPKK